MFTIDDESDENKEKAIFSSKITQLLLALCSNYEVIFLIDNDYHKQAAQSLYELLIIAARAKNLDIVFQTSEFWTNLKENLLTASKEFNDQNNLSQSQILMQIDQKSPFCQSYIDMLLLLHQQCQLLLQEQKAPNGAAVLLEIDADEQSELRGISVSHFRD